MTSARSSSLLSNLVSLLVAGLLAGAVLAAAAFPAAAVAGLTAKAGANTFESLPSELQTPPLPQTTTVLTADGKFVTQLHGDQNRIPVPLSQVSPWLPKAVVAIEDARFYEHHGVDLKGILRAFVSNSNGDGGTQGASTITQQYVRQDLVLTAKTKEQVEAANGNTIGRKLREIRFAVALEKKNTKQQILEKYLNTVFFGKSAYGVKIAAQRYFGKDVSKLSLAESSMLASFIQSPGYYPTHLKEAEVRRQYVLTRMQQLGYASAAEVADAKAHPPTINLQKLPNSCLPNGSITPRNNWGYFCDYLRIWAQQQTGLGNTPDERWNNILQGGYTIKLSLDSAMQADAQDAVDNRGEGRGASLTQGIAMIEPGTGRIKSLAVNRTFAKGNGEQYSQFPLLTGDPSNQSSAGYASGSTFKMFVMLAALEQGIQLDTGFYSPHEFSPPGRTDGWSTTNASKSMDGYRNMWSGFGQSVNTYFVQLAMKAKISNVAKAAQKAGITFWGSNSVKSILADGDNPAHARLSLTFGQGSETFPLYMANAYATVAARGMYCAPTPVLSATGRDGKPVSWANPSCKRVFSQGVADAATDAARCPVGQSPKDGSCGGWSTGGSVGGAMGRPVAGKTGSTPGNKAVWFAGFVPQLAAASFSTDSKNPQNGASNGNPNVANEIFNSAMPKAVENMPEKDFTAPPDSLVSGGVHDHSGEPADPTPSGSKTTPGGRRTTPGTDNGNGTGNGGNGPGRGGGLPGLPFAYFVGNGATTSRRVSPQL